MALIKFKLVSDDENPLLIQDAVEGSGQAVANGDSVEIEYVEFIIEPSLKLTVNYFEKKFFWTFF